MRILQICSNLAPRKSARNGGELRYWQNLASLVALGHEVHLVLCEATDDDLEPEVRELSKSVHGIRASKRGITRPESWRALIANKAALQFYLSYSQGLRDDLAKITLRVKPDLIWADWIGSMALVPKGLPVIYSHHDFHYKISATRAETQGHTIRWPDRIRRYRLQKAELALCARADHVVCVSSSEKEQLDSCAKAVTYIPIVGPTIGTPPQSPAKQGRIFLFGTSRNTALRHSIRHCRQQLYPLLQTRSHMEWHQVGEPEVRDTEDWRWVQSNFQCHGFVKNLGSIFRLGDGVLMPYAKDTGFRTRFVTAAAYGVVNIGYEITFRCVPEFTNGINCSMAKSPEEMADVLSRFSSDPRIRQSLGAGARMLYEREFAFESQLPKYEQVLRYL